MFEILQEWFGMGLSLPVIATDLFFAAIGLYAALKISNKKTVIYIMLTMIVVYIIVSFVAESGIEKFHYRRRHWPADKGDKEINVF